MDIASGIIRNGYASDAEVRAAFDAYWANCPMERNVAPPGRRPLPIIRFARLEGAAYQALCAATTIVESVRDNHHVPLGEYPPDLRAYFEERDPEVLTEALPDNPLTHLSVAMHNMLISIFPEANSNRSDNQYMLRNPVPMDGCFMPYAPLPHIDFRTFFLRDEGEIGFQRDNRGLTLAVTNSETPTVLWDIDMRFVRDVETYHLLRELIDIAGNDDPKYASVDERRENFKKAGPTFQRFEVRMKELGATRHVTRPGEVLLMPGDTLHHVQWIEDPAAAVAEPERVVYFHQPRWQSLRA